MHLKGAAKRLIFSLAIGSALGGCAVYEPGYHGYAATPYPSAHRFIPACRITSARRFRPACGTGRAATAITATTIIITITAAGAAAIGSAAIGQLELDRPPPYLDPQPLGVGMQWSCAPSA